MITIDQQQRLLLNVARRLKEKITAYAVGGTPEMFPLDEERFDLFVIEVIDFIFSPTMRKRAEQIHQFGDKLILKIADPHDIILMKCATDRLKDKDDARKIINLTKIN